MSARMGAAGRQRAEEFSWERVTAKVDDYYGFVIRRLAAPGGAAERLPRRRADIHAARPPRGARCPGGAATALIAPGARHTPGGAQPAGPSRPSRESIRRRRPAPRAARSASATRQLYVL